MLLLLDIDECTEMDHYGWHLHDCYYMYYVLLLLDKDECTEMDHYGRPLHNCHMKVNSKCVDTEGSFYCECDDGFKNREDVWLGSLCIGIVHNS